MTTREHDVTIATLRAQVNALIDRHEQAIRDTAADVRASCAAERASMQEALDRALTRCAALETTVDVLAGRVARGAG